MKFIKLRYKQNLRSSDVTAVESMITDSKRLLELLEYPNSKLQRWRSASHMTFSGRAASLVNQVLRDSAVGYARTYSVGIITAVLHAAFR